MYLYFCDVCRLRIPEQDFVDGRAWRVEDQAVCAHCSAQNPPPSAAAVRAKALATTVRTLTAAAANPITRPGRAVYQSDARPQMTTGQVALFFGGGTLAVLALAAVLFSSGTRQPERDAAVETPRPAPVPETKLPAPLPLAPARSAAAPPVADKPPANIQGYRTLATTVVPFEDAAQKAFDTLFDGVPAADIAARIEKLKGFNEKYGDSIVAARARILMQDLQKRNAAPAPAQNEPAPAPAPAPATTPTGATGAAGTTGAETYLSDLPESDVRVGYGEFGKKGSLGYESKRIFFNGAPSLHGLSMHPPQHGFSHVAYQLGKQYKSFKTTAAIDDSTPGAASPLVFKVLGDGKLLWNSEPLQKHGASQECNADVSGVDKLELIVECPGDFTTAHTVWLEPRLDK